MVALPTPVASGGLTLVGRPVLTGTLPVTPFGDRLVGTLEADGQQPKVAALAATTGGQVIVLSLVGFDTSVSAALAKLHANKGLTFQPGADLAWAGASRLTRLDQPYHQLSTPLAGTRERHALTLSRLADIGFGLLHPPAIPDPTLLELAARAGRKAPQAEPAQPRYVLGNASEETPERQLFLGHLRALRVIHLPHWAERLWTAGLDAHLIAPQPALGVRCWRVEGDHQRWSALLSEGVRRGWLHATPA